MRALVRSGFLVALSMAGSVSVASIAAAQASPNQSHYLPAPAQTKINKAQSRGKMMGQSGSAGVGFKPCPPGTTVENGAVKLPPGAQAPREVVVSVGEGPNGKTTVQCR